jgi:hypothetical protein
MRTIFLERVVTRDAKLVLDIFYEYVDVDERK